MGKVTRRRFLGASAAAVGAAAFPKFPNVLRAALAATPAGNSLLSVQHVVILMQENRSFDHYFGTLQGTRGFADRTALTLRNGKFCFQATKHERFKQIHAAVPSRNVDHERTVRA